ncbi:MAG: hypothetical protein ThorAB25_24690 [Candidatus Thorarchaeota archaeon AB_25]|nr:MAG: hypothetical protein ThorAB25_24690 [Candidatus Thorarchaeota archaeon AB_25]
MQIGTDLVLLSSMATVVIAVSLSGYLGRKWLSQENRLITDLPLVFAIAFVGQAFNIAIVTLQHIGLLPATMIFFRIRTIGIGGSVIPIFGAILQIWTPSIQRYHNRMVYLLTLYWLGIDFLVASETLIMSLLIPVLVINGLIMMATFIITWRTGRLKEVRSELMVLSVLFGLASQVLRVPLLATSLFYVPDVLLMISMILTAVAFGNPWYNRGKKTKPEEAPHMITVP